MGAFDFLALEFAPDPPAWFDGSPVSSEVPWPWPVAIGGHPYAVDLATDRFGYEYEARVRDAQFQGTNPDESAIAVEGLWGASKASWHRGAGQDRADAATSDPYRFHESSGVDVWEKERITLLPAAGKVALTAAAIGAVEAADKLWIAQDTTTAGGIEYVAGSPATTPRSTPTGMPTAKPVAITTDGGEVFVAYGSSGVYKITGAGAGSSKWTGTITGIWWVKGRMLATNGGTVYDVTGWPAGALPTALYVHPATDAEWIGFAAGRNAIYGLVRVKNRTSVMQFRIAADGTRLDQPAVAADLPYGEYGRCLHGYISGITIGLSDGVRFAEEDGVTLVVGPKIPAPGPVYAADSYDRFTWYGYQGGAVAGIARLDPTQMIAPQQPAWATDLMGDTAGDVKAITRLGSVQVFTVGANLYYETANPVASGWVTSGAHTYNLPDAKVPVWLDVQTQPLAGSVLLETAVDEGAWQSAGVFGTDNATEAAFRTAETPGNRVEWRATLTADGANPPTVEWVRLRVFAAPRRSKLWFVPIRLFSRVTLGQNVERPVDVAAERAYLDSLLAHNVVTTFQAGARAWPALVEDIRWIAHKEQGPGRTSPDWEGIALVSLRIVED